MNIVKKVLAGGLIADLTYVMGTNAYANTVLPATGVSWETSNVMQILAGACGILICVSRVIKTIAEAYLIKKQADRIDETLNDERE